MNTSIWANMQSIRTWERVTPEAFRAEIEPLNEPAILRNLVAHWPAVAKAKQSPRALADYLLPLGTTKPIATFVTEPAAEGRFFYREDLLGLNFAQRLIPLDGILKFLLQAADNTATPALYAGGVAVADHLPGLLAAHTLELIEPALERQTSAWIGNRTRVAAHWDQPQNIACVVCGLRRYTLFPITQAKNLYIGPLDRTPAGPPISLVDFHRPDFERHPKFREALDHASVAELRPGDALFIPSLWVHHAESLDSFGLMINFWWHRTASAVLSPFQTMLHALLTLRGLPAAEREGWRELFEHYVFERDGDPMTHIPMEARGMFATLTPERVAAVAAALQKSLAPFSVSRPSAQALPTARRG